MHCPFCGVAETRVKVSRSPSLGLVNRRRVCAACGRTFSTTERVTAENLTVRKRSGAAQQYVRNKIVKGINKAASIHNKHQKHDKITPADVNAIVDRVEAQLREREPNVPVSSVEIGRIVLQELYDGADGTDVVRIRYAIVFQGRKTHRGGFRGVQGLLEWIQDVYGPPQCEPPPDTPWEVRKRDGRAEPFRLKGLAASIGIAAKGHGTDKEVYAFAERLENEAKLNLKGQAIVTSQQIAAEVLKLLIREGDILSYLRYASAVKGYTSVQDFWLEAYGVNPDA